MTSSCAVFWCLRFLTASLRNQFSFFVLKLGKNIAIPCDIVYLIKAFFVFSNNNNNNSYIQPIFLYMGFSFTITLNKGIIENENTLGES